MLLIWAMLAFAGGFVAGAGSLIAAFCWWIDYAQEQSDRTGHFWNELDQ